MVGVNPEDQSDDKRAVKQPQYPWAQRGYHLSAPYRTLTSESDRRPRNRRQERAQSEICSMIGGKKSFAQPRGLGAAVTETLPLPQQFRRERRF